MGGRQDQSPSTGKWLALAAALLGWMFDGLEMGLFPLVARPLLKDLLQTSDDNLIGRWFGVATASFLVGAATGGVLFGWLGDRIGRVRAMTLSVLTYALFSGLCGVSTRVWQVAVLRFVAALGMGGEWSLGVALVMEIWPNRSRAFLAGLIGAAANVGYLLVGVLALGLERILDSVPSWLRSVGLAESIVAPLTAHSGWRLLLLCGAAPAVLTFFIRIFVPESSRWEQERQRGTTSHWAGKDLLGVGVGGLCAVLIIYLWAEEFSLATRLAGTTLALAAVTFGYLYPAWRYFARAAAATPDAALVGRRTLQRMLLGACLSGIALLGTWASIQWAPTWADKLAQGNPQAKAYTQICMASGAIAGTLLAAWLGDLWGRRITYCLLCLTSLASALALFQLNSSFGTGFLLSVFLAGGLSASFYGWLPLYLPELFHTGVRATGQGFSFNFGRIIAAVGALQTGSLTALWDGSYPAACSTMSLIYLLGVAIIWLAPETRGKPLPA
jgi:MFS family permease